METLEQLHARLLTRFPGAGAIPTEPSQKFAPPVLLDLAFLDNIPLADEEMQGRNGRNKNKRRAARKTYSDLAYLMNYIQEKVEQAGAMADSISLTTVDAMFRVVADEFEGPRNAQKKWSTFSQELRRRNKAS